VQFLHDLSTACAESAGVDDGQIDTMLVQKPKAFFTSGGDN
jgi:predicted metal-dependent phosphotriesterase family hydrolase